MTVMWLSEIGGNKVAKMVAMSHRNGGNKVEKSGDNKL